MLTVLASPPPLASLLPLAVLLAGELLQAAIAINTNMMIVVKNNLSFAGLYTY
ncbi:hypothetical protein ACFSLH_05840 [Saccharococcus thermophilus]|uniref:Uncharacterized protein n=1 Tax=Saccharococcus thermophilus TaxID=29396 RepID=A0A846MES7_9BACL|nr:hypothetical protein [Saccharococcus thermophilus]NIK14700.1 hypothetical protein [Saccharococcus thermophilus]